LAFFVSHEAISIAYFAGMTSIHLKYLIFLLAAVSLLVTSCGEEKSQSDFVELDLLSDGMPIVIQAPSDPIIKSINLSISRDITVKKGPDFSIQIYESDARVRNPAAIKARLIFEVQGHKYFNKIMSDDDQGFIYQTMIDSSNISYGFRHFRLQGDKEYVFQTAIGGKFTLEAVQEMYHAVQ
jgi:hypothetical protein